MYFSSNHIWAFLKLALLCWFIYIVNSWLLVYTGTSTVHIFVKFQNVLVHDWAIISISYTHMYMKVYSSYTEELTFSWKNEQWKWTVLPDIESRCKSFLLSVLWTTTCSMYGIPTGLQKQMTQTMLKCPEHNQFLHINILFNINNFNLIH